MVVCLSLAGAAYAQALEAMDLQEGPKPANVLAGFEEVATGDGVTVPHVQTLAGGRVLTMTPQIILGTGTPEFQDRDRTSKIATDGSTSSRALGLYDNVRVSIIGGWANTDLVPANDIEIAGLAPNTAYDLRIGAYNVWALIHQKITPINGTTGPVATLVHGLPNVPMATMDSSVMNTYTTDATGNLTVRYEWDRQAYLDHLVNVDPTLQAETSANIGYIELTPEPASLCLLAMGGLALLRRRR
jgi:hypothetical protein